MTQPSPTDDDILTIEMDEKQSELIDQGARSLGLSREKFILAAAIEAAQETLSTKPDGP